MDVRVTGIGRSREALRRLRSDGDREIQRALSAGARKATGPLRRELRRSAKSTLPSKGGLAGAVSKSKISVTTKSTGGTVTVRVTATSALDIERMDAGRVRHPLYGNHKRFYNQAVPPGWWSRPAAAYEPRMTAALQSALDSARRRMDRP